MNLADAPRRLVRLAREVRREGPLRLAAEHARRHWMRVVDDRIAVYEWRPGEVAEVAVPAELWVGRYGRPEEVPASFYRQAEAEEGRAALDRFLDEFLGGGMLWVPWVCGRPAGYQWTKCGGRVRPWHVELGADATLAFSVATFRPYRGRGVASATLAEICRREVAAGGRAVGECCVWNTASVRMFEAAGFRRVAEYRPYRGFPG